MGQDRRRGRMMVVAANTRGPLGGPFRQKDSEFVVRPAPAVVAIDSHAIDTSTLLQIEAIPLSRWWLLLLLLLHYCSFLG